MKHRNKALFALAVFLYSMTCIGAATKWFVLLFSWLATGGVRWTYLFVMTVKRDVRGLRRLGKVLVLLTIARFFNVSLPYLFRHRLKKNRNKVSLINEADGKQWTYQEVEDYSNRVANYFHQSGLRKGDTVAFFMENRPEYIITWFGLIKLGVIPALINSNLRNKSLIHSVVVANCKAIVYGTELQEAVKDVYSDVCGQLNVASIPAYHSGPKVDGDGLDKAIDLDFALTKASTTPEPAHVTASLAFNDALLYIYTSGTTGMPKAAIMKGPRMLSASLAVFMGSGLNENDVVYSYLPMYHSLACYSIVPVSLIFGATSVIRKKFSATNFWKDCIKHNVTATHYLGETVRYICSQPVRPEETGHSVRIFFGAGLREHIFDNFRQRFRIPEIVEFYASTEGNVFTINLENKPGSIGFLGVFYPKFIYEKIMPSYLVKVDEETGEPIRDERGFCIKCRPGEQGEFVGKIKRGDMLRSFDGYKNKEATKKKVLTNVFEFGDEYFRSGDIMTMDELGWLKFKDRAGDTFRWKGENVSTLEVESVVGDLLTMKTDVACYGVEIPHNEGKAGMVAIAANARQIDWDKLYKGLQTHLPVYARPLFVRMVKKIEFTGTYKIKKNILQKEGFNRSLIPEDEDVLFMDVKVEKFVPLTLDLYKDITNGTVRC